MKLDQKINLKDKGILYTYCCTCIYTSDLSSVISYVCVCVCVCVCSTSNSILSNVSFIGRFCPILVQVINVAY